MKLFNSFAVASLACPCQKVGENDFGMVRPGNSHADSDLMKFYAHIDTPIGNVQIGDFKFVIQFSSPVEAFTQYFAEDNFNLPSTVVEVTPGQNMISGDPYTFNIEMLSDSAELTIDAWFCSSKDDDTSMCTGEGSQPLPESPAEPITSSPGSKLEWTEISGRRVAYGSTPMTYYMAQQACKKAGGALPWPKSEAENQELDHMKLGGTWLNFDIDEKVVMSYENFQPITTRPVMNPNGKWSYGSKLSKKTFFCVEAEMEGCQNIFSQGELAELDGKWMVKGLDGWEMLKKDDKSFEPRSTVRYSCDKKIKGYKKWRKASKHISLTCVRMNNGDWNWAELNNYANNDFDRCPWWTPKMERNVMDMMCLFL